MKFSIYINQLSIIENGLDIDIIEASILNFIIEFSKSEAIQTIEENGVVYFWISYEKVCSELPILKLKKDSVYRRMKKLCEVGLLEQYGKGKELGKSFFALTKECDKLNFTDIGKFSEGSEIKPKDIGKKSEAVRKKIRSTSDENPYNKKTNIKKTNIKKPVQEIKEEVSLSGESGIFSEEPKTPSASNDDGKLYSKMVDLYFNWFKDLNGGIPPKFGKADGSAMKQIINYFKFIHKQANNGKDEVEEVILMFTYILTNWAKIDPFLQKQTKLIQINGNIQNIINDLKNGKRNSTSKSDKSEHARTSRVQDAFGKIDDIFNSKR